MGLKQPLFHMIKINTLNDYQKWTKIGRNPLYEWRYFTVNSELRKELQFTLFANNPFNRGDVEKSNQKYYEHCWKLHPEKICENCKRPLGQYSSIHISHILSRKEYPEYALDPRNHNLLCGSCHKNWETNPKNMLIYPINLLVIAKIKVNNI